MHKVMTLMIGALAGIVLVTEPAQAEGPGTGTMQRGQEKIKSRDGGECRAYTITAKWNLDSLLGTATDCFDADTAKHLWKNGTVVDFVVVWD